MNEKRLCSMGHPAAVHRERVRRFFKWQTNGVLWRHSSVNLVDPQSIALAAANSSAAAEDQNAVSITGFSLQPAERPFRPARLEKNWGFPALLGQSNLALTMRA